MPPLVQTTWLETRKSQKSQASSLLRWKAPLAARATRSQLIVRLVLQQGKRTQNGRWIMLTFGEWQHKNIYRACQLHPCNSNHCITQMYLHHLFHPVPASSTAPTVHRVSAPRKMEACHWSVISEGACRVCICIYTLTWYATAKVHHLHLQRTRKTSLFSTLFWGGGM